MAIDAEVPPEVDEFVLSGLTAVPAAKGRVPRVKEAHVSFVCRLRQIVACGDGPMSGSLVLGDIVAIHIDDNYCDNFRVDPDKLRAIGRMGGMTYARTTDRFELVRPEVKPPAR